MIYKKLRSILGIGALLLAAQFSSQKSSADGKEKPSMNVYGLLTDSTGQTFNVENITISGRVNDISVYTKPASADINPDINKTIIDLCAINEIQMANPNAPKIMQFNKRDYIEIVIFSNGTKTRNVYIIEKLKKIFCQVGDLEKELSFLAIKSLKILGCKKQESQKCLAQQMNNQQMNRKQEVDATITKTQALITELQQKTEKLDTAQDSSLKAQMLGIYCIDVCC